MPLNHRGTAPLFTVLPRRRRRKGVITEAHLETVGLLRLTRRAQWGRGGDRARRQGGILGLRAAAPSVFLALLLLKRVDSLFRGQGNRKVQVRRLCSCCCLMRTLKNNNNNNNNINKNNNNPPSAGIYWLSGCRGRRPIGCNLGSCAAPNPRGQCGYLSKELKN